MNLVFSNWNDTSCVWWRTPVLLSTPEGEAEGSQTQGQPGLQRETLFRKKQTKQTKHYTRVMLVKFGLSQTLYCYVAN